MQITATTDVSYLSPFYLLTQSSTMFLIINTSILMEMVNQSCKCNLIWDRRIGISSETLLESVHMIRMLNSI